MSDITMQSAETEQWKLIMVLFQRKLLNLKDLSEHTALVMMFFVIEFVGCYRK